MASKKKYTTIENDTPILPVVLADTVIRELWAFLYHERGFNLFDHIDADEAALELAKRAEAVYAAQTRSGRLDKGRWARTVRGVNGREHLCVFFRHWLAAFLKGRCPVALRLLPYRFELGAEAPKPSQLRLLPGQHQKLSRLSAVEAFDC